MNADRVFNIALLLVGLAASFFLSFGAESIHDNLGLSTPGYLAGRVLFPPDRHYADRWKVVGESMKGEMIVDWIFWFAVMWLIYFLVVRLSRKFKAQHR